MKNLFEKVKLKISEYKNKITNWWNEMTPATKQKYKIVGISCLFVIAFLTIIGLVNLMN